MDRRKFLAAMGLGTAALTIPTIALGASKKPDRIITLDSPGSKCIRLLKDGHQIGCVYWANVDTKQYRRTAFWMDFADIPWDGGRIVRHPNQADMKKITYGPLHRADLDQTYVGPAMKGTMVESQDPNKVSWSYLIDQYPVVDYESYHSNRGSDYKNCRTTALSVEGTFDEIMISEDAPPEILALYHDLPRYKPSKPVNAPVEAYIYESPPVPRRTEYVVKSARTADELAEEMRRWVAGENDLHDQVISDYKRRHGFKRG